MRRHDDTSRLDLSRRERQILDVLYRKGEATAAEVRASVTNAPSYSAVRTILRIMETKGIVKHKERGLCYVFFPTIPHAKAKQSALRHVVQTFFDNSVLQTVVALIDISSPSLTESELSRLAALVERARGTQT